MEVLYGNNQLTGRTTSLTLLTTDAGEEVFLSELIRVMMRPNRRDRIKVTRADGETYLTWKPRVARRGR